MGSGLGHGLGKRLEIGDGENRYSVHPGDPRWIADKVYIFDSLAKYLRFKDEEETQKIDLNTDPYKKFYDTIRSTRSCECGAQHTVNPNLHSRWCPLFEEPMGGSR